MKSPFNKFLYFGFLLLGAYYFIFQKDYSNAVANVGIAFAFDPFNQEQPWNERPMWQKAFLIVHLVCFFALFVFMLSAGDR